MIKERRHSKQREYIYQFIMDSNTHPSAEEVYTALKVIVPGLSLGTVYRNLRLLVDDGRIREFTTAGSSVSRFDGVTDDHEHVICTACGKIIDIPPTINKREYQSLSEQLGGVILSHTLSYFGICKDCAQKANVSNV